VLASGYDAIAEQYAEQYFGELDGKPFDRDVLDRFAAAEICAESGSDLQDGKRQARELATWLVVLMFGRHERSVAVLGHRRSALFNRGPQSLLGASSAMIPTCPCSIPQSLAAPSGPGTPDRAGRIKTGSGMEGGQIDESGI